ncbi:MAG: FTR1 family iron permease [Chloroflexi bacterium]|nr:FTR1 family iron permease [Chloroflexota bacterium]
MRGSSAVRVLVAGLLMLVAGVGVSLPAGLAWAATPSDDVQELVGEVDRALAAVKAGDPVSAEAAIGRFNDRWLDVEEGVRALSRSSYRGIEDAQAEASLALKARPVDVTAAVWQLERLRAECDAFVLGYSGAVPSARATAVRASSAAPSLATVVRRLGTATTRLDANDPAGARSEIDAFAREWPDVEGLVKARSARVYTDTENNTARVRAALNARPPDTALARDTLGTMQRDLAPIVESGGRYGPFDAAAILLREGLEALLVIGALLAFLRKSGNADKGRWIWAGSGLALLASVLVALSVNAIFSRASAGANRELLEGLTGLVAAVLLLYVSYWLHAKSSLGAWQQYIHTRGTAALAGNSMLSLAALAFLAVFREGAETVLFYLGIAPSIETGDLLLGLGIGTAGLVVCGVLILGLGVRLPLRPFFLVTSALIYYLAFKFVGSGVHALQVSGYVTATPEPFLPSSDLIGLFPTLETTIPQVLLVLAAAAVLIWQRRQGSHASAPSSQLSHHG